MILMYKRRYRDLDNNYPAKDREKFLKSIEKVTCELGFLDYSWTGFKDIFKAHREYDKTFPKEANNYSGKQIKNGLEKLVELGFVDKIIEANDK